MKKIIFLFMALFIVNTIKAQQTINEKVVEHAKAIVAYEMNVLSLHPNKDKNVKDTLFENFKEKASQKQTVDDVKKYLPDNYDKNKKLCDEIKDLNNNFFGVTHLVDYFSDSIFQQKEGAIGTFVTRRDNNDVARLKKTIKEKIQEVTNNVSELFDPKQENIKESSEIQKQNNTEYNNNPLPDSTENSFIKESTGFTENPKKYVGYLLAFVVTIIAVILFKNNRRLENEYNDLQDEKERNSESSQKKEQDLQNKINLLKQKNVELERRNRELQKNVDILEEVRQMQQSLAADVDSKKYERNSVQNNLREYYLGIPQDGLFAEGFETYKPGKVLYKVTSIDGIYGDFEYINRPEAIGYAKQSRTSFLEPACNISGEDKTDFIQIETKNKGKVERTSNGWKIIKKADICLV